MCKGTGYELHTRVNEQHDCQGDSKEMGEHQSGEGRHGEERVDIT